MENAQFIIRSTLLVGVLVLLCFSQLYWFRQARRLKQRKGYTALGVTLRCVLLLLLLTEVAPIVGNFLGVWPESVGPQAIFKMWLFASFCAWVLIRAIQGTEHVWGFIRRRFASAARQPAAEAVTSAEPENFSRRNFFRTATYFAGAVPFIGTLYGLVSERKRYTLERVEIPLAHLPAALDGLRIAQISDIHLSGYMSREDLRRAVDMANQLGAELAVVTGDFITSAHDSVEECAEELAALRAPLGVWGCLGNHEIYADCEDRATEVLRKVGLRVLRRENAEILWRGQPLNLIGVDYQRMRGLDGRRLPVLAGVEPLVRRDVPNILLSHNPNAFDRAAEMGIEFTLAGHTHGGQVNVEILESQINPARFMTDYVAGLYSQSSKLTSQTAHLYVNRGLGTIGVPVRIGAPPEITLLTLRRA